MKDTDGEPAISDLDPETLRSDGASKGVGKRIKFDNDDEPF
jgi:hypothetical protein